MYTNYSNSRTLDNTQALRRVFGNNHGNVLGVNVPANRGIGQHTSGKVNILTPETVEKIKAVSLSVLTVLALLFVSVLSFGIVPMMGCYYQHKRIKQLQDISKGECNGFSYQWSKPLYQSKSSDPKKIKPSYEREELAQNAQVLEAKKVMSSALEMDELLKAAKPWAEGELKKCVSGDEKIEASTVHRWLVYLLVKHAGLSYACDQTTAMVDMNAYINVGRSDVCEIRKSTNASPIRRYLHKDSWTPKNCSKFPNGVDPISLKFFIHNIEKDSVALKHFETLLIQQSLPKNDKSLKEATAWLEKGGAYTTMAKNAENLIDEIIRALEDRYPTLIPQAPEKSNPSLNNTQITSTASTNVENKKRKSPPSLTKIMSTVLKVIAVVAAVLVSVFSLGVIPFSLYLLQHQKIHKIQKGGGDASKKGIKGSFQQVKYKKSDTDAVSKEIDKTRLNNLLAASDPKNKIDAINSLEPLVEGAFTTSFNQLIDLSKKKKYGVVFSKSSQINEWEKVDTSYIEKYIYNKNSLYNWLIYQLIPSGSVRKDDISKEYRLFFNDKLSVGFSQSCSIPTRDQKSLVDFFLNKDEWTVEGKTDRAGIDPVSIYWILQRIKTFPTAVESLEALLLSSLIPDNERSLKNAKKFLAENSEEAKLVRVAYELIGDIGRSMGSIYRNSFYSLWEDLADDDEAAPPLLKGVGGINVEDLNKSVEWIPNLEASPDFPQYDLVRTQSVLTPVWKDIHKYRIRKDVKSVVDVPVDEEKALELLSKQYYWIHVNVDDENDSDGAGCILSALCIHLYQATDNIRNIDPQDMKDAFADYLTVLQNSAINSQSETDKETLEHFKLEIEQTTKKLPDYPIGWTVDEYIAWLRTNGNPWFKKTRGHFDMGQLEIELFCKVFGIGVHVFRGGEHYRLDKGLMMPTRSYGSNTEEKIILFNATGATSEGFSFYALMPTLRYPIKIGNEPDRPEIVSALEHNRDFWGKNHGKEWNESIEAQPRL